MKWNVGRLAGAIAALTLLVCILPARANGAAPELWFAPTVGVTAQGPDPKSDVAELFQANAPWSHAAAHVRVVKLTTQLLTWASDDFLSRIFTDLKRRHIALSFEALMLTGNECGNGVEGYAAPKHMENIAARVRRLGGELAYMSMDEPLWFGHHYTGKNACQSSIADLAQDVAAKIAAVRHSFPDVRVGDTEPLGGSLPAAWTDEILTWARAFREAVGEPLPFFQADIQWHGQWLQQSKALAGRLHESGTKFGIIYNGSPDDPTDIAWTTRAEERFVEAEGGGSWAPDQAILQTWMLHPVRNLPETEAGTMTNLLDRYVALPTILTVRASDRRLDGRLTDSGGNPVDGAVIRVFARDNDKTPIRQDRMLVGTVPAGANRAIFRLRLNTECSCSGPADISVGQMRFLDERSKIETEQVFNPPGLRATWPGAVQKDGSGVRISVEAGQPVLLDTPGFPVTAGAPYEVAVPLRASPRSRDSGYVAVVFFDQGREVQRRAIFLEPGEIPAGSVNTDASGQYSFLPTSGALKATPSYRVQFAGDAAHRLSSASLP